MSGYGDSDRPDDWFGPSTPPRASGSARPGYPGASGPSSGSARPGYPGASGPSSGSARVPGATPGRAPVGGGPAVGGARVPGTARVPVSGSAPVSGRATPGAAGIRPVSPAGPAGSGPAGSGKGRRGRRAAGPLSPEAAKRARRRKIANWSIAAFAVVTLVAGVSIMGLTYAFDDIPDINTFEPETSTVVYADGSELTKLGAQNRTLVPAEKISPLVKHAVAAAEDQKFYEHSGIDLKGIARAAWNNISGGNTQGASTITQQYARHAAELTGINYNRKIREALLARKIEDRYEKDEIISLYLNAIYFGRGAHGVEAAAKAYFNKSVTAMPGEKDALTASEAAVLASVIKQPEPDPVTGHQGYDPHHNAEEAKIRWGYTLDNMVEAGWITSQERSEAAYPEKTLAEYDPKACQLQCLNDKPVGLIMEYVRAELAAMGITDWQQRPYKIQLSINPAVQKAAEEAASRKSESSPMHELPENHQAALVAIDPKTGQVLAYYGGDDGAGFDFAGLNGGHSPGSTAKMYTLAAALREGMSMESRWDSTIEKDEERDREISNAGRTPPACAKSCSLEEMTIRSWNSPFYMMTKEMGPEKVVEAARDAGIKSMWTNDGDEIDLTAVEPTAVAPSKFDVEVGFGQYPVKVIEHVNGLATLAAGGVHRQAHFVVGVERKNPATGAWVKVDGAEVKSEQAFEEEQVASLLEVLQKIPASSDGNDVSLDGGRPAFAKSGTWELGPSDPTANGDAWYLGATRQVATGVWVGTSGDRKALTNPDGEPIYGGQEPASIWKMFMDAVHAQLKLEVEQFPEGGPIGDPAKFANGLAVPETPVTSSAPPAPGNGGDPAGTPATPDGGAGNPGGPGGDEDDEPVTPTSPPPPPPSPTAGAPTSSPPPRGEEDE
ncbi:transglycosylase domain-containing protein [Catenuloplanes atrovinosus]|uniref:Membrane peptidoglycan carboxypeptidase n=1 Tax=Catenuloplanes atrovinosus TaxID=137266 RepID=A0AAE3YRP5_9ACTN|nr:transglycosylase domain-containing protein [Catenuloplanes atrovinosus]MDR7276501.1 membrane peptidoglycan carboxypeptidase [Catenuloplanes atrovinosus]